MIRDHALREMKEEGGGNKYTPSMHDSWIKYGASINYVTHFSGIFDAILLSYREIVG